MDDTSSLDGISTQYVTRNRTWHDIVKIAKRDNSFEKYFVILKRAKERVSVVYQGYSNVHKGDFI